jgi:hypothetical protein
MACLRSSGGDGRIHTIALGSHATLKGMQENPENRNAGDPPRPMDAGGLMLV